MKARIYTVTHKAFTPPPDPLYVPLQVGAACPGRGDLGFLKDDSGENISEKNPFYSELTGMYWIWKNDRDSDILGLCHYRRYLLDRRGKLFTEKAVSEALRDYDAVTTKKVVLDHPYQEAFGGKHNPKDLVFLQEAVAARCPAYLPFYEKTAGGNETYFGNMLIVKRSLFMEYSAWLFDLLFTVEKQVDMTGYNDYQKRLYGFLSELLLMVYLRYHGCRVLECGVAVIGGKKETEEAVAVIAAYFKQQDLDAAGQYYMELYRRRPDVLMEASDTEGKLKLITQMLSVFYAEREKTGHCYLERQPEMEVLLKEFADLNEAVHCKKKVIDTPLSEIAVEIAETLARAQ